jgi:hypothetical protein
LCLFQRKKKKMIKNEGGTRERGEKENRGRYNGLY